MASAASASTAHLASLALAPGVNEAGYSSARSSLEEIMGVPIYPDTQTPFPQFYNNDKSHYQHSVPQCFLGTNRTTLPTQIVFRQLLAGTFWLQRLAPIVRLSWAQNYVYQWDTIEFDPNLPNVTPEEGRTRIGTWKYDSQHATVNRYGVGARFSHEFLLTPKGMMLARGVLDQLNLSIEEHLKLGVMKAIMHAKVTAKARAAELNQVVNAEGQLRNLHLNRDLFGIMQFRKREDAIPLLLNRVRETMRGYGGEFDTCLMHWSMAVYATILNDRRTEYYRIGDSARSTLDQIVSSPTRLGEGPGSVEAFLVQEFNQGRGKRQLDLLKRTMVYGEVYPMFDHIPVALGSDYTNYTTQARSISVLDGDGNSAKRTVIQLERALRGTNAWDARDGRLKGRLHPDMQVYESTAGPSTTCSFWGPDGEAIRYWGNQAIGHFNSASQANLAQTIINRVPNVKGERISEAFGVISAALDNMASASFNAANLAFINAYLATAQDVIPNAALGGLPPFLASGRGLRAIANTNPAPAGFSASDFEAVRNAVLLIKNTFIPHLKNVLGPNNALLSAPAGGLTGLNAEFDNFINNAYAPNFLSLVIRNPGPGAAAAPVPAGEDAGDARSATLTGAVTRVTTGITGRLGRRGDIAPGYVAAGAAVPLARAAGATIVAEGAIAGGAAAADDDAVFDPVQTPGGRPITSAWAAFHATLPAFARSAFPVGAAPEVSQAIPGGGSIFAYQAPPGGATPQRVAHFRVARLLLTYGVNAAAAVPDAVLISRAIILTLLSAARPSDDGANLVAVANLIEGGAGPIAGNAPIDIAALKARITAAGAAAFGDVNGRPRDVPNILALIDQIEQRVRAELAARPAAAAGLVARQFVGQDVMRVSQSNLSNVRIADGFTVYRPGTRLAVGTQAELDNMVAALQRDGTLWGPGQAALVVPMVVDRDNRVAVPLVGMVGGLPAIRSETAAAAAAAPAQPGSRSRYAQAAAVPVAPAPLPDYSAARSDAAGKLVTVGLVDNNFAENWHGTLTLINNPAWAAIARVFLATPTDWVNCQAMLNGHVLFPATVLLARPTIILNSYDMYLLKAGTSTLFTVFGQANTTWGNNTDQMAYSLNIVFKSATICVQPKNIFHLPHGFLCGIEGGWGTTFFTPATLQEYLAGGNVSAPHDSLLAILEPYQGYVDGTIAPFISLAGTFANCGPLNRFNDAAIDNGLHYYNGAYARRMWGFAALAGSALYRDEDNVRINQLVHGGGDRDIFGAQFDFLCHAGQYLLWNPHEKKHSFKRASRGFFPDEVCGPRLISGIRIWTHEIPTENFTGIVDI